MKAVASSPNSSVEWIARRLVRSPSPWAMSCMALPITCSGCISRRISMLSNRMISTTAMTVATMAEARNSLSSA
ncbi:hypothetical protein D3C84_1112750 [compost metagenome]